SVALGDVNADGRLDIVTANWVSNNVSVLLAEAGGGFAAQATYAVGNEPESVALGDVDADGGLDIVTANYHSWNVSVLLGQPRLPRVFQLSAVGADRGTLTAVRLHFSRAMDQTSFSPADDVISFSGPRGPINVTGFQWINPSTLELQFDPQSTRGAYVLVLASTILDTQGNMLDQDGDQVPGEADDDRYTGHFVLSAPRISSVQVNATVVPPAGTIRLMFTHVMDTASFQPAEDIVSLAGPDGPIALAGYGWISPSVLELRFDPLTSVGVNRLVLGPQIHHVSGTALDQDRDGTPGETLDDRFSTEFTVRGPRITGSTPSLVVASSFDSIRLTFDRPMDAASFAPADDVVSFTGPQGAIAVTGFQWIDPRTLEVRFAPQSGTGSYTLLVGPNVLDTAGNAMDQSGNGLCGASPGDQFQATVNIPVGGALTEDTTWTPENGAIVVTSTIYVPEGITLTIQPGTIVKFAAGAGIHVHGTLLAAGTAASPVVFTSLKDDVAGGDTNGDGEGTAPAAGDWVGIAMRGGTTDLAGARIHYADIGVCAYGDGQGIDVRIRNSEILNGNIGTYAGTPFVEIAAENVLIAHNAHAGIQLLADNRSTYRNATIVGNGFAPGHVQSSVEVEARDAGGVRIQGSSLVLENCIVAFNANGLNHWGDFPNITIRNSLFHNPGGQEVVWYGSPGRPDLAANGNTTADPLFVDRSAGNYQLSANSPAIDSGRGIDAPPTDLLGRARYDDLGMPNVGTGYPSYVDMGAYERQEDTLSADLAMSYVSPPQPLFVQAGERVTVSWSVENRGAADFTGSWQDAVYLSDDPFLGNDMVLGTVSHDGPLAPGAHYSATLEATAATAHGPKYVLVRANAAGSPEAVLANNVTASSMVLGVDVPLLDADHPVTGTLTEGEWQYARLRATAGNTLLVSADTAAEQASFAVIYLPLPLCSP
ncbi:MAG TPA: FG-GAP-like repeat-containing protein, partial [Candidatus Anammoximicrobium sp.]|nr:FG-GAP-like repeat-containing protein [Candidatus Anammoximicrobium sp.]